MNLDEFWRIVESARADQKPTAEALVDRLASRSTEDILDFQERFDDVNTLVYLWDVWAAAYLIGGGCSDDSFADFRAGLIAQGREWFEKAARSPDSLADHPTVMAAAAQGDDDALFYEEVGYAAGYAYDQLTDGDGEDFYEAWEIRQEARGKRNTAYDMGEDFDFDDKAQMRARLPRLAAIFLP